MNLHDSLTLYQAADSLGPGSIAMPSHHHGVITHSMKKRHGFTQVFHPKKIAADSSSTDLASHHTWTEPSSTDVTIKDWRSKRQLEKKMGRNVDPFEGDYERQMYSSKEQVTGPCGCTLKIGEKVRVEGNGQGVILARSHRILTVSLREKEIQVDQKFVHRPL